MSDHDTTLSSLRELVRSFVDEREWRQFHNPKDLSISLVLEAAELLAEYQWMSPDQVADASRDAHHRARVAAELADVLIYAFSLANALDMDTSAAVTAKLTANAIKYPAERFRGRFRLEG